MIKTNHRLRSRIKEGENLTFVQIAETLEKCEILERFIMKFGTF